MGHDAAETGAAKTKFLAWVPFVACALAVIVGRQVGKYTSIALGFQIPSLPPGVSTSIYDGRFAGGAYGGVAAFIAGWVIIALGTRWPALRNRWLALGLLVGALFAAAGAYFEGTPPR